MKELKHTKGPWVPFHNLAVLEATSQTKGICDLRGHDRYSDEELRANAKLIASAPCLLEALMNLVEYENRCRGKGDPMIPEKWYNQAKYAIKKATE